MVPFGQGFKDMSPVTKKLMKLAHIGHLALVWMMDNIHIHTDPTGNIKPDKQKSTEKIDWAVAMIMALDRCIRNKGVKDKSVYDERRLLVFWSIQLFQLHHFYNIVRIEALVTDRIIRATQR